MSESDQIYMDHHATTPVDRRVVDFMLPFFSDEFGNAASKDHEFGARAEQAVKSAREQIADAIGAEPKEIIFTSGATESNNIALVGTAEAKGIQGGHIITAATEHKAILDPASYLENRGIDVTYLGVDSYGLVDPDDVRTVIRDDTILVSIMAANNEIGTIAPIEEIGAVCRENGVLFHTDATQFIGYCEFDVEAMNVDLVSFTAHKLYGPKGVGALYVRWDPKQVKLGPVIRGGGHERGYRSGTLNVPGIVGFGKAIELAEEMKNRESERLRSLTHRLWDGLTAELGSDVLHLNGHAEQRIPNNLNISIEGVDASALLMQLPGVALATGSACTSATVEPSHVIQAISGGSKDRAFSAIRFGLGRGNTVKEVETVVDRIADSVSRLQRVA